MTVGVAQSFADAILNLISGSAVAADAFTATHAQAHTGDPGAAGTTNSAAGSFSGRAGAFTWGSPSGTTTRTKAITNQPEMTATAAVTVSHLSLWSAVTAGTFRGSVQLSTARTLAINDILRITSLSFSYTPVAT